MFDGTIKPSYDNSLDKLIDRSNSSLTSVLSIYWDTYLIWLDQLVIFFKSLVDTNGNLIPIIFRPYHEVSNSKFFWWHLGSPADYITLWCKTVDYLRSKGLHNLLFAFCINDANDYENTNETNTKSTINNLLSNYYPGDDYVDIIAFDAYQRPAKDGNPPYKTDDFKNSIKWHLETIELFNASKNKVIALTEVGADNITVQDYNAITKKATDNETESKEWWTEVLLKSLNGKNLAYLLVWRNPYKGKNPYFDTDKPDTAEIYAPFVVGDATQGFLSLNSLVTDVKNIDERDQKVIIDINNPLKTIIVHKNNGITVKITSGEYKEEERSVINFRSLLKSRMIFIKN